MSERSKESGVDQEGATPTAPLVNSKNHGPASESLQAGQELDILVAQRVFGWHFDNENGEPIPTFYEGKKFIGFAWRYRFSTDIAAAWKVVEKMDNRNAVAKEMGVLTCSVMRYDNGYTARFFNSGATAETAPLAICLAALRALDA